MVRRSHAEVQVHRLSLDQENWNFLCPYHEPCTSAVLCMNSSPLLEGKGGRVTLWHKCEGTAGWSKNAKKNLAFHTSHLAPGNSPLQWCNHSNRSVKPLSRLTKSPVLMSYQESVQPIFRWKYIASVATILQMVPSIQKEKKKEKIQKKARNNPLTVDKAINRNRLRDNPDVGTTRQGP